MSVDTRFTERRGGRSLQTSISVNQRSPIPSGHLRSRLALIRGRFSPVNSPFLAT